jgi:hypothetical protein
MSTLRVNTIQNSGGTGSPAISGLAAAWVNFNGTGTVAIRASSNVSSITDQGTGVYLINFTNALSDTNYALSGMLSSVSYSQAIGVGGTKTTSAAQIVTGTSVAADFAEVDIAIFR